jgi:hypothetical protein
VLLAGGTHFCSGCTARLSNTVQVRQSGAGPTCEPGGGWGAGGAWAVGIEVQVSDTKDEIVGPDVCCPAGEAGIAALPSQTRRGNSWWCEVQWFARPQCRNFWFPTGLRKSRQKTEGPTVLTGLPNERVNETRRFVPVLVHRAQILLNSLLNNSLVSEAGS